MEERLGDSRNKRKGLQRGMGLGKDYSNYSLILVFFVYPAPERDGHHK